jgi:hypothetical protein
LGRLQREELSGLIDFIRSSGFVEMKEGYTFPGEPFGNGGLAFSDMGCTISIEYGDLHKTVSAWGYLTPADMPYPLNEIYQKLKTIALN